ncbi:MAG: helix-turn-helix domain-containing protein [Kiritimatiellae bacterium]|nr:helix-turn-helix domain-containing protein [Kiritimatiellia bacterium]MDD5520080.1 helix-turn-helix domain-containing protein [Kiritimatiellia bacterium]
MYDPSNVVYDSLMKQYQMQKEFLSQIGSFEPFKLLFDLLPNVAFYIKDLSGRIMVINRRNCMNCNIPNELSAIGKTSYDLFPSFLADEYYKTDMTVIKKGKPLFNMILHSPDYSTKPIVANKVPVYDRDHRIMGVAMMYYYADMASNPSGWDKHLGNVVDYIHRNYAQQIKIEKLVQIACVSESHLKRIFKRLFGMSPIEYVILTRINASRDLLETTARTVSDIAQEVGFYDHSHFIRHFRHIRGCTPNQYRKQHMHTEKNRH